MKIKITLSLLIVFYIATSVDAFGRSSASGSSTGPQAKSRSAGANYSNDNSKKSKDAITTPKSSGRNIPTLQIVFILTLIMTLGFAGYYFVQFYPFLCSKESKYDVMSRASVTPTHSREFEYDESTSSATKSTNASYSNEHDV